MSVQQLTVTSCLQKQVCSFLTRHKPGTSTGPTAFVNDAPYYSSVTFTMKNREQEMCFRLAGSNLRRNIWLWSADLFSGVARVCQRCSGKRHPHGGAACVCARLSTISHDPLEEKRPCPVTLAIRAARPAKRRGAPAGCSSNLSASLCWVSFKQ